MHTAEDIQTEQIWNFSFPFFLCFPSGILILSAWNRESLWLYLDNSHAENLQEKGTDFLHKLLVQQLNGWLLPLQKIYSSKRQLFTKGTHKHIKQLGLKMESSRKVQKCYQPFMGEDYQSGSFESSSNMVSDRGSFALHIFLFHQPKRSCFFWSLTLRFSAQLTINICRHDRAEIILLWYTVYLWMNFF